jgi:Ca-activated chloride channel family protein
MFQNISHMKNRLWIFLAFIGMMTASCHQYSTRDMENIQKEEAREEQMAIPRTASPPPLPSPKKDMKNTAAEKVADPRTGMPIPPPPPVIEEISDEEEDGIIDIDIEDREDYNKITENPYLNPKDEPLSTFSIDVDNASYSNVRRILTYGSMPNPNAVRIEEMINYFTYDYAQPTNQHPFSINTEVNECPWNKEHKLLHVGLQGYKVDFGQAPANNLVFLLDVSGSMSNPNKLPLVKESMEMILQELREEDRVAIVVYAGAAGVVLPSTSASEKGKIMEAIDNLSSGGSTAGGEGINLAYKIAKENFKKKGNNRIILCTDGDFNVGVSSQSGLEDLIEKKRNEGTFLTVLGFGMGNYQDSKLETLSNKGNGNYGYIDNIREAKKMLVDEMGGTFLTIAKDVKIQVEFNPEYVDSYRLIGYENRKMANRDFDDDTKDAGELGAGHSVTALYEIVPKGKGKDSAATSLRYQERSTKGIAGEELAYIKFRYKKPDGTKSILMEETITNANGKLSDATTNYRFSAAVAGWGMLLRNSEHKGNATYEMVYDLGNQAKGTDGFGYRKEFLSLVKTSEVLSKGVEEARK